MFRWQFPHKLMSILFMADASSRSSDEAVVRGQRPRARAHPCFDLLPTFFAAVVSLLALSLVAPQVATAEIYRWTDAQGRLHFAQDLAQVPAKYRRRADAAAKSGAGQVDKSRVQTFSSPPASASSSRKASSRSKAGQSSGGETHRIRVTRAGSSMRANVLINNQVMVPFILDTGASDVVLPEWAADELGLDLSESRTAFYRTANGVISSKLTQLDSVKLGTAEVRGVPTSISTTMQTGLLGLSFFNHFKYRFDPGSGIVTLQENDLAESGLLKGGRSQGQWRAQFGNMQARIEAGEQMLDDVPSSRSRKRAAIQQAIDQLHDEYKLLEDEADDARVPFAWRD